MAFGIGPLFLSLAVILGVLVTISVPYIHVFDLVRVSFPINSLAPSNTVDAVRFGIWGDCYEPSHSDKYTCQHRGFAYEVILISPQDGSLETIGSSYTRGLILHPIALGVAFVAFALSWSSSVFALLMSAFVSWLAALLAFLAFVIDIVLYARVRDRVDSFPNAHPSASFGPAFWMTLVQILVLIGAGFTVCFARRRRINDGYGDYSTSYPMANRKWYNFGRFNN